MSEPEEENTQAQESEGEESLGLELLFFALGGGFVLFGLLFVVTGVGLIGLAMIFGGGLICLIGSAVGVIIDWRSSRLKKS